MDILIEIRKFFSDLRVQIFLAVLGSGIISVVIALELLMNDLINYEQFDYGSTVAFCLGSFLSVLVITIRSKGKESPSNTSTYF